MKQLSCPTIVSTGTRYQIGLKIGAQLSNYITVATKQAYESLNQEQKAWLSSSWKITQQTLPEAANELVGIAHGADVAVVPLFSAFCEELLEIGGCTDIIAIQNGKTLIGHTNDERSSAIIPIIIKSTTPDLHNTLGISLRGLGYSVGFNSAGLSFTGNHLTQNDIKEGVPRLILFGEMMYASSFEKSIEIACHPNRASGYNYVIATPGKVISLEVSGKKYASIEIKEGVFAHANHFLDPQLQKEVECKPAADLPDSIDRLNRANKMLHDNINNHSVKTFYEILSNRDDGINSICNHEEDGNGETVFSVIIELENRNVYFSNGRPCTANWHALKF